MTSRSNRDRVVDWCLWVACGVIVTGGAGALVVAAGGPDRVAAVGPPFAVAAIALAANALSWRRTGGFAALLYGLAVVAIVYGLLRLLSIPLRLAVEGTCQPAPAPCPLGYDYALTSGEMTGMYIAVIAGALAVLSAFIAAETQYRQRPGGPVFLRSPAPAPRPEPPPQPPPSPREPAADPGADVKEAAPDE